MTPSPMSLRRAVEIVELGCPPHAHPWHDESAADEYTRARAILAAAVEAHEAYESWNALPSYERTLAWNDAMDALRKLERGE